MRVAKPFPPLVMSAASIERGSVGFGGRLGRAPLRCAGLGSLLDFLDAGNSSPARCVDSGAESY